ncbi:MAG: hypothetical protein ACI8X5_002832 [Planctomycetota bacterium]|jgi:hypothetical protein
MYRSLKYSESVFTSAKRPAFYSPPPTQRQFGSRKQQVAQNAFANKEGNREGYQSTDQ